MASPTFGMPTAGNNAPPPTFGSMTNPTGGSTNMFGGGGSFPNYPLFGSVNNTTTPLSSVGAFGGNSMSGLTSGFQLGNNWQPFDNSLGKAYGVGPGQMLYNILNGGLFNPQVASSFLNAMQPGIAQGQSNILNSFGAEGSRFGSAAAYGLGQYNSQVNLNEQQTLAGIYEQAQQEQLGLLSSILPTLHSERANQGGILGDVLGGLETIGGIAAAPFTGGMSLGLTGMGINSILGANGSSTGGSSMMSPYSMSPFGMPGFGGNTGTFGSNAPIFGNTGGVPNSLANSPYWMGGNQADIMSVGGGATLGGNDPYSGLTFGMPQ